MDSTPSTTSTTRSAFVTRLSWILLILTSALAISSIYGQIVDFRNFDPTQVPGVQTAGDAEIFAKLNRALLVFSSLIWGAPIYVSWSLGRRRNWARIATLVLLGFLMFFLSWIAIALLLHTIGVIQFPIEQTDSWRAQQQAMSAVFTLIVLGTDYLCWRILMKLRSAEVVQEFR